MCGVIAWINIDQKLVDRVIEESLVRGLHHLGRKEIGKAGIAHTRYCTSGDTPQPINVGKQWLAFNGVIDMGTKAEMEERWKVKLTTDNDGELYLRSSNVRVWVGANGASFAGVILEPGKLTAFRNANRPLWRIESKGGLILASTRDILFRAGLPVSKALLLEPLRNYTWNI